MWPVLLAPEVDSRRTSEPLNVGCVLDDADPPLFTVSDVTPDHAIAVLPCTVAVRTVFAPLQISGPLQQSCSTTNVPCAVVNHAVSLNIADSAACDAVAATVAT